MMTIYRAKTIKGGQKKRISLTDNPAIELEGIQLSEDLPQVVDLESLKSYNEEKRIVAGPALVPNKLIPRKDKNGDIFFITFTEEDIREYFELWKEDGGVINWNHTEELSKSSQIVDAFIVGDKEIEGYTHKLEKGSLFLMTQYDEDEWQRIKKEGSSSYSIEGDFEMKPFYLKSENTYKLKVDGSDFIEKYLTKKISSLILERINLVNSLLGKIN